MWVPRWVALFMWPFAKIVIVALLLVCVCAVFLWPMVDLEPTALRAWRAGLLLLLLLTAMVRGFTLVTRAREPRVLLEHSEVVAKPSGALLAFTCVLLC
jgi:hypothetical protein